MKQAKAFFAGFLAFVLVVGLTVPLPSLSKAASSPDATEQTQEQVATSSAASGSSSASADEATVTTTAETGSVASIESIPAAPGIDTSEEGETYASGEVLVVFKDSADSSSAVGTLDSAVTLQTGQGSQKQEVTDSAVIAKVADGATVAQAVTELAADPDVEIAQPNYRYTLMQDSAVTSGTEAESAADDANSTLTAEATAQSVSLNDPYASEQWHLNDGNYGVNCYSAWNYATCDNKVGVAVIDTGCLVTHKDLADNIVGAYNAYNASKGTGSTTDVTDTYNHGTHVAGIIAAESNNGIGGSGVSYNANVVPIKACDSTGGFYDAELLVAYKYLIANRNTYNIRVVNMSIGGKGSCGKDNALMKQIDAAYADGILTVCAAGNAGDGLDVPYDDNPGDYATCVSVINLTSSGTRNSSSNYNSSGTASSPSSAKNISAPGTNIYSTYNTGGYGSMDGTSMASPVVAGVAALVFAANSSLTAAECKDILYNTATDLGSSGWDRQYGYGEVNALAAVKSALSTVGNLRVVYKTHVQDIGWQSAVTSTPISIKTAGTTGKALRLEGIKIAVTDASGNALSNVLTYSTHIQNIGWQGYVSQGKLSGTTGKALRLEGIRIKLTSAYSSNYDVYYRVHAQNIGWMDWASNGEEAGTAGYAYRLEAIQVVIVKKGEAPASTSPSRTTAEHFESIKYRSYLQNYGWKGYVFEGATAGTTKSLRVEALRISLGTSEYSGSVKYRVYVAGSGWQAWKADGKTAGTTGKSKQLGALQVKLSGAMASHYDVYYRVRIAGQGWTAWKKDGATAGKANSSTKITAYQVKLVPKG